MVKKINFSDFKHYDEERINEELEFDSQHFQNRQNVNTSGKKFLDFENFESFDSVEEQKKKEKEEKKKKKKEQPDYKFPK